MAVAARHALETADWPAGCRLAVRFAIHVGEVESRDGDYYGTAVNRAARIRGLAAGGQILVSQAVAEVVIDHLPEGVSLAELGEQELLGLTRPERICAVVDAARPIREAIGGLCPYKGLLAYQPEDDDIFFGREAQTADLLGRLLERRFVVVVGASGSGKSSLVRAGVLAAIRRGEVPGSASWSVVIVTPGENPATGFTTDLQKAASPSASRIVVAVDQMEELFTVCRDPTERARFVDVLLDAVEEGDGSVMAVGALRADFYGHCAAIPRLARALSDANVLLGPMDEDELRRAIEAPAEVAGLSVETGLVDVILRDLAREPGSLPLLSHALLETWQRRIGTTLTLAGYHDSGGVRSAIARTAETAWTESLTEQQRPIVRRIFLRLTELGEGTEDTRRRVARTELVSGADGDAVDEVLRDLADRRLITVDDDTVEVAHEALIREWPRLRGWLDDDREGLRTHRHLTHAAEDWNALGRDASELYRGPRLQATRDWLERDPSAQLNELETAFFDASAEQERAERAEERERIAARERANRRLRILLVASAIALVVAIGTGAVAIGQRGRANRQADRARAVSVSAEVDRAVAEVPILLERDRSLALLLAVQAQRIRPDAATNSALFAALVDEPRLRSTAWGGHEGYAWMKPLRPNQVVALGRQGADVWDLTAHEVVGSFDVPPAAAGLAISPDGALIAAGSNTGTVGFWDASTLQAVGAPIDAGEPVRDVAFTPDGQHVAIAVGRVETLEAITPATTTYLWDVSTRQRSSIALAGHETSVNALAVSPDGQLLAAGDNSGRVLLHDPATGEPVGTAVQVGPDEGILGIAFSPDGSRLGIGTFGVSGLGRGHVVDVAARTEMAQVGSGTLVYVGFNEDGSEFVTAGESVEIWDLDRESRIEEEPEAARIGQPIKTQHGPATITSTGAGLVLSGFDGTMTIWDPLGLPTIARVLADAPPAGATFSPDGTMLAAVDNQDSVALYRVEDLHLLGSLSVGGSGPRGALDGATPVAFSPDSRTLAVGDRFGAVQLFDAGSQQPLGEPIRTGEKVVVALAFSPDGRTLAAMSNANNVNGAFVIDLESREVSALDPPVPLALSATFRPDGEELIVTSGVGGGARYPIVDGRVGRGETLTIAGALPEVAAFSFDGSLLAIGRTDGTLSFHEPTTLDQIGSSVPVSSGLIGSMRWSADGKLITLQDINVDNFLVDVDQRARIGDAQPGNPSGLFGVSDFAPDGRALVLPGPQGTTLWDLDVATWPAKACTIAGRDLTADEWETYFSSAGTQQPTCPGLSSAGRG